MNYEKPQNDTEILSADEQRLREICLSLKKVDAPNDFDFTLKARIASANPSDLQPRFGFAFRYAFPALALIFVLGLLAYNSGFWSSPNNQIIAGGNPETVTPALPRNTAVSNITVPDKPEPPIGTVVNSIPDSQKLPKKPEPQTAQNIIKTPKKDLREVKNNSGGGSKVLSLTPDVPLQPNFTTPVIVPKTTQSQEESKPIPVKEVLSINGINADFENGRWTVKSVTANSLGESSGVKENDVIEAIDDQPLSADTVFNKTAGGKTITVTRSREKLRINLRNKQ